MRASSALKDIVASAELMGSAGPGDDLPMLPLELETWFSPSRPRIVFKPPYDMTRVLLVEDDPLHRRIVRVILTNPRISLIEVTNGQAALDLLAMKSFDLVIIGGQHSVMTNEETVRWIRASLQPWSDIAIMVLLDGGETERSGRLISSGATDWTRKPVRRDELVSKMVALMPALHDAGL